MANRNMWSRVLILALCVASAGFGCSGKTREIGSLQGADRMEPSDVPLGERFELTGRRVENIHLPHVLFRYDSFQVDSGEIRKIEEVAAYMRNNPDVRIITEGHCDERGSRAYNISLGENRAQAVRANLVKMGINSMRIQTRSYGEERPISSGHNEAAWRRNRRVEFAVYR
ncbi:MAG: OmpA family protein [Lentisphaerae bacterium]|nr:OmpA family protein [Lentisphaerota bacterium]